MMAMAAAQHEEASAPAAKAAAAHSVVERKAAKGSFAASGVRA
jgi:hypothetical protein